MNIDKFEQLLNDSKKTKEELLTMRANAVSAHRIEHVHLAEKVLDIRFPSWRNVRHSKRGGPKATEAMFRGVSQHFDSEIDAYIWLVEKFIKTNPEPFRTVNWETEFIAQGPRSLYFSRSLARLFKQDSDFGINPSLYRILSNGWYTKAALNPGQKFNILLRMAAVSKLKLGEDWDWNGIGHAPSELDDLEKLFE
jgi:hypothetical protein